MTSFRFDELTGPERYKMLCAAVIPRPVAWVTSVDAAGVVNAAPFSFFNVFCEDPALVIIGMNRRAEGETKDSLNNVKATGEFAVNLADTELVEKMVGTAAAFPAGVSEAEELGLELEEGQTIATPHLKAAPVALECRLFEARAVGPERHLVIGEVLGLIARDGLFDPETKRMTVPHYDPVARLFASGYARLAEPYDMPIPDWRDLSVHSDR